MSPRFINYIITMLLIVASLNVAPCQSRQQPALLIMNYVKNFVKNNEQLHWYQAAGSIDNGTSSTITTPTTTTTTTTTISTTEVVPTTTPTTTTTQVASTSRPTTTSTEVESTSTEVVSTTTPTTTSTEVELTTILTTSTEVESTTILTTSTEIESTSMPTTTELIIVTGERTEKGEFPFVALIEHWLGFGVSYLLTTLYELERTCGGTLLNARYVLTTAYCATRNRKNGGGYYYDHISVKLNGEEIWIEKAIPHPKYKRSIKYKDIGLLRMDRSVKFASNLFPACIRGRKPSDITAIAAGWGRYSRLLKTTYDLYPNLRCDEVWDVGPEWPHGIDDSIGCAGVPVGRRNTQLSGDNEEYATLGGPVFVTNPPSKSCKFSVIGIITSGAMQCGPMEFAPDNYTSLSKFIDWTEEVIYT